MAKKGGGTSDTQKEENRSQGLWITYPTYPTSNDFLSFRRRHNISAAALGTLLGGLTRDRAYSRSYIKHLEGGSMRITPKIASAFDVIRSDFKAAAPHTEKQITIISQFKLRAGEVHLNLRPRKCRGHQRACIMSPTQIYCGTSIRQRAECQKLWKKKNSGGKRYGKRLQGNHPGSTAKKSLDRGAQQRLGLHSKPDPDAHQSSRTPRRERLSRRPRPAHARRKKFDHPVARKEI